MRVAVALLLICVVALATANNSLKRSKRACGSSGCGAARRCGSGGCGGRARSAGFSRRCGFGGCGSARSGRRGQFAARSGRRSGGGCGRGGCGPAKSSRGCANGGCRSGCANGGCGTAARDNGRASYSSRRVGQSSRRVDYSRRQSSATRHRNEHYRVCGHNCEPSCASDNRKQCTRNCVSGYHCNRGYVRDDANGGCIQKSQCPLTRVRQADRSQVVARQSSSRSSSARASSSSRASSAQSGLCNLNEDFSTCGSFCEPNCNRNANSGRRCPNACVRGCFCRNGYKRDSNGGCVQASSCGGGGGARSVDYESYEDNSDYGVEQPAAEIRDIHEPTGSAFFYDETSKKCVACGSNEDIDCPRRKTIYGTEESCKIQGPSAKTE